MNIFKKIWNELKRDPIKEAVETGYKLGRKHQKEEDAYDSDYLEKYHTFSGGVADKRKAKRTIKHGK